jgi:hypothetical protein
MSKHCQPTYSLHPSLQCVANSQQFDKTPTLCFAVTMFYHKYYHRRSTAQGSGKTLSKNYGARLAQGPLQSLKALDPNLHKPDVEAPDARNLQNAAKTNMYRFGPKNLACEARQRSLHNAGKLPVPPGPVPEGPEIARTTSRARARTRPSRN